MRRLLLATLLLFPACHRGSDAPPPPPTFLETHAWLLGEWFADIAVVPSREIVGHGFFYVDPGRTTEEMSWVLLSWLEPGASVTLCPLAIHGIARPGPRGGVLWETHEPEVSTMFFPTPELIGCVFNSPCSVETFGFLAIPLP